MAFEIRTEYDAAHLEELQWVLDQVLGRGISAMNKKNHYLLGGVMLVAGAIIATQGGLQSVFGVLACGAGIYVIDHGRRYFMYTARKIRKKMPQVFTGNDYTIDEMGLQIINAIGTAEYAYEDCSRLVETGNNLYLIMKDNQGMILDKANIEGGSVDELRTYLIEHCSVELEKMEFPKK